MTKNREKRVNLKTASSKLEGVVTDWKRRRGNQGRRVKDQKS